MAACCGSVLADSVLADSTLEDSTLEDSTSEENAWHVVDDTDSPVEPEITQPIEPLEGPWALENQALRDHIRRTLAYYFYRPETTARRSPWEVMHAVIGFGVDTPLMIGDREVNAIAWLCANGPCYNMRLMNARDGRLYLRRGPGFEGHAGQLLTVLAQSRVPVDYPIRADGQFLTVADLVRSEQMHCRSGGELTFQLIGLAYYLDPEARWENDLGESWDLPRMIKEEIEQPIVGAACGGTHRLTALSYAVRSRERSGQPVSGQWKRAQSYLEAYYEHTFKLQNPDGSFSTSWFAERGDYRDIHRKLNTTGHTAEWLVYSLPEERLTEPQVVRAIRFLTDLLWQYRGQAWSLGAQGHAIHALCLFDERVFDGRPGQRATQLAGTLANAESAAEMTAAETGGVRMEQQEPARNGPFLRRMRR